MKRTLLILAPLVLLVGLTLGFIRLVSPSIETWARLKIRALSSQYLPVEIDAESLSISFFPPGITAESIDLAAKDPTRLGFDEMSVQSIRADLDILQLLVGKIAISDFFVEEVDVEIKLNTAQKPTHGPTRNREDLKINLKQLLEDLSQIPLHRLHLSSVSAEIQDIEKTWSVRLVDANVLLVKERSQVAIEAELPADLVQIENFKDASYLRLSAELNREHLSLGQMHLTLGSTELQIKGDFSHPENLLVRPEGTLHLQGKTELKVLHQQLQALGLHGKAIPDLDGTVQLNSDLQLTGFSVQNARIHLQSQDLDIDDYPVGDLEILGNWSATGVRSGQFTTTEFSVTNDAAKVDLKNFELKVDGSTEPLQITAKTQLSSDLLDLHELLEVVKVGSIPLQLNAGVKAQCEGPLFPNFHLLCEGAISGNHFEVGSGPEPRQNIARLDNFNIQGQVSVDAEQVKYQAQLQAGETKATSSGTIGYETGFQIQYASDHFDFASIQNLAFLKIKGVGTASGMTRGDSHKATFFVDLDTQDSEFEDYKLGSVHTHLDYAKGLLHLQKLEGTLHSSRYSADLEIDLLKNRLTVVADSKSLDLADLQKAIELQLKIPFELTGPMSVHVQGSGPLSLSQMDFTLQASGQHLVAAAESLESLALEIQSVEGHARLAHFQLNKSHSQILGAGTVDPNGNTQLNFSGAPLLLEDLDFISRLDSNIFGQMDLGVKVRGLLNNPELIVNVHTHDVALEEKSLPPSDLELRLNRRHWRGQANLLEGSLTSQFQFPLLLDEPFYFEASARNWQFTNLFSLLGSAALLGDYQSSLTGDLSLHSERGGFTHSDGEATIMNVLLARGQEKLQNPGPIVVRMSKGHLSLENFRIAGSDSFLEASGRNFTMDNLNVKFFSKLPLHLVQIFLPFADDIGGLATVKVNVMGSFLQPNLLGSGTLQDGFLKIKGFPHAFEKVNASAQFSQQRVLVSDITGVLGGGSFEGDGALTIEGPRNFPLNFHFDVENVSLQVPRGVKTTGSGNLNLTGSWFPFLLSGEYHINNSLMTKEMAAETGSGKSAQQSYYLPKSLQQNVADPLNFDIKLDFENPIQIKNSLIDGRATGPMTVKGSVSNPTLIGKANLEKGSKVFFNDKPFEIAAGSAIFSNPREINPEIYVSGSTRVSDYDINLIAQGTANAPVIRLSSAPPLAEQDIISLMALGTTTNAAEKISSVARSSDQQQNSSTQALVANVASQAIKPLQKVLEFDFQASSQYDDTKNMTTQSYTFSKKMGEKVSAAATWTTGDQAEYEFKLKYKFNSNWNISTSLENLEPPTTSSALAPQTQGTILGLDLEYKMEFK